ncbi:Uncharacterised protein [Vibrio cholerae]|nr:Uncharacterised protein [Vibrio cholerae]
MAIHHHQWEEHHQWRNNVRHRIPHTICRLRQFRRNTHCHQHWHQNWTNQRPLSRC